MRILLQLATQEPYFAMGDGFVDAVRAALPEGAELVVTRALADFRAGLPGAVGVVGFPFPSAWVRHAPALRFVHLLTAGVPEGLEQALAGSVRLSSSVGRNAEGCAEHALSLLLASLRGLSADGLARWAPASWVPGRPLHTRRVGVVGRGAIGARCAALLRPLAREVVVFTRTPGAGESSLEALRTEAPSLDAVVIALPNRPETRALFDASFFASLAPGAVVVNVARGALVDEAVLLAHLARDPAARYAADVAVPEPYPDDGALRACPQVLLTPHVGGRFDGVLDALTEGTIEALRAHLAALGDT